MKTIAWLFKWLLKAAIFFTLFAFALNNRDDVTVHFFFGQHWTAPMALVVLTAFAIGLLIGVLGMVPRWWRQRHAALNSRRENIEMTPSTSMEPASGTTLPPHGV